MLFRSVSQSRYTEKFLNALKGVTDPEAKRKIIGREFIRTFEEAAAKISAEKKVEFLVQGTLYPDVVESGGGTGTANIKSHHNVGGLPEDLDFTLIEPLRSLFKDEVREVGRALALPEAIVERQPFPGPGLAIRIIGEVTEESLNMSLLTTRGMESMTIHMDSELESLLLSLLEQAWGKRNSSES